MHGHCKFILCIKEMHLSNGTVTLVLCQSVFPVEGLVIDKLQAAT